MSGFAEDYIEVAERIREWYERYPDAAITTHIVDHTPERVVVKASVFRLHDDAEPAGTGHSALAIPGSTPYTRGSELENAETSAVGRALVMAGLPSKRVASADEIKSKQQTPKPGPRPAASGGGEGGPRPSPQPLDLEDDEQWAGILTEAAPANGDGGHCPVHHVAWTHKPAGTSKAGKPYNAFWACSEKNDDGSYCAAKPTHEWLSRNVA